MDIKFRILNHFTQDLQFEATICAPYGTSLATLAGMAAVQAFSKGISLQGADLANAGLYKADLTGANLTNANLTYANLTGANLRYANLTGANLTSANLTGANLTGANLTGARLDSARLIGANLIHARLTGANLIGARLIGARLASANLIGANLRHTDLIDGGQDSRGYQFIAQRREGGDVNVMAGCCHFASLGLARAYWERRHGHCLSLHIECLAKLDYFKVVAEARGWGELT